MYCEKCYKEYFYIQNSGWHPACKCDSKHISYDELFKKNMSELKEDYINHDDEYLIDTLLKKICELEICEFSKNGKVDVTDLLS